MDTLFQSQALVEEDILSFETLYKLLSGNILAIRVPNFYQVERCRYLSRALSSSIRKESKSSGKIYISDVDSFWNTMNSPEIEKSYFKTAITSMRKLRRLCFPYPSPSDLLRLELDEIWPYGASIMHLGGNVMLFGNTRIWPVNFEALPHQDLLRREIPDSNEAKNQVSQLGVNVHLSSAQLGGELEIWNYSFSDEDCLRYGVKGSYGFNRSLLPAKSLIIKPQEGDLIVLDTTKVHAVKKVLQGEKVTVSGFVGFWGIDKPLKCWS